MGKYACGDIHGQWGLFQKMLDDIRFSGDDKLYIIGDLIDRGPDSLSLLQYAMEHKNVHAMLGNHELMMYVHYRLRAMFPDPWFGLSNGGRKTAKEFEALSQEEQEKILEYLLNMDLQTDATAEGMDFLLSHSAYIWNPNGSETMGWKQLGYRLVYNTVWSSPWRTEEFFDPLAYRDDNRWHVVGHVPVQGICGWERPEALIDEQSHIVNIDLACGWIGCYTPVGKDGKKIPRGLCCMDLEAFARGERKEAFRYYFEEEEDKRSI